MWRGVVFLLFRLLGISMLYTWPAGTLAGIITKKIRLTGKYYYQVSITEQITL